MDNEMYCGLRNLGNTCFLNTTLQILSHTTMFTNFLNKKDYKKVLKPIVDSCVTEEFDELRTLMYEKEGTIIPKRFIQKVFEVSKKKGRDLFTHWAQNDVSEFFGFIMECMHNSISRPIEVNITGKSENNTDKMAILCYNEMKNVYEKEYSEIMDIFYGVHYSQIVSMSGKVRSTKAEHFFSLDLAIPNKPQVNIYDCLDEHIKEEIMKDDNGWFNEKTHKKEDVKKRVVFWNFPNIVMIVLKRFSMDGRTKNNELVNCPLYDLNLSKYVQGYNASTYVYELYAIANHIGDMNRGHYTCYTKTMNGKWLDYDDETISEIEEKDLITPMSYCLFYRKKNN